ncbi:MAG: transporter substrate-binding domain-containing protein [Proteobacteria bacterium]|nr:transporter substrate-binding domain-containing protein [Pseudomonadota bacterium]
MLNRLIHRILCWTLLLACSPMVLAAQSLDAIKTRGTLRVGVEPGFLPFEMRTPKNEWVGFDVEMVKAFSAKLGVKAEFISTKWDGIIPGLMAGKYDLIASGMTITEERAQSVLFSQPYYEAGLKILIKKGLETQVKSLADCSRMKALGSLQRKQIRILSIVLMHF